MLRRKAVQLLQQLLGVLGPRRRGRVDGLRLGTQRGGARPVDRAVDDDSVQPRPERAAPVEAIKSPHRREKAFLRDVLGRGRIANDQVGRAVGRPPVRAKERLEIRGRPGLGPPHPGPLVAAGARHGVPTIRACFARRSIAARYGWNPRRGPGVLESMKRALVLGVVLAALLAGSAGAAGPSPGIAFGSPGVVSHDGKVRYVALRAGIGTLVEAVSTRTGMVRSRFLKGFYGLPMVAYDRSMGGLARNGKTLIVNSPGERRTRFLVLDPRTLKVHSRIALSGNFGFDALSPDGSVMYLIQIRNNPNGPIAYDVRALNVNTGQLYPGAIVDRREPNEKMAGIPMTRAGSDDGSWAYTLYS